MQTWTAVIACGSKFAAVNGDFTIVDVPYRNHTDLWAVRDTELRREVRAWLRKLGLPAP